jgi:hypothetical protein
MRGSLDHFITALHTLSEHCGYGDMRDQLIRNLIVVGIRDDKLSEKMQLDPGSVICHICCIYRCVASEPVVVLELFSVETLTAVYFCNGFCVQKVDKYKISESG